MSRRRRNVLAFEHRSEPLAPFRVFAGRVVRGAALAFVLIGVSLAAGMLGYGLTEGMGPVDAFVNAAMLLGGMGPVSPLATDAGKVFAGVYALYCGLLLIAIAGLVLAPVVHRVLHALHADPDA